MRRINRRTLVGTALSGAGLATLLAPSAMAAEPPTARYVWNVYDFGAKGDGNYLNTRALQAAIDACAQAGGGLVVFPSGNFLTGSLLLKDNVYLHLSPGTTLTGTQDRRDYPEIPFSSRDLDVGGFVVWALIRADGARNIGIVGEGTINGNGKPFGPVPHAKNRDVPTSFRPRLLFLKGCNDVTLSGVTLRDSACWTAHFALCRNIKISGLSIHSNFFYNQDGIVLDSCRDATVSDCLIDASDDCIVIKASFPEPCKNLVITNCVLTTTCAAIKFGSQSLGGFANVSVSNCVCYDCELGGLKFETVDGGDLVDVCVSNITMHDVSAPFSVIIGNRAEDYGNQNLPQPRPIGRLRNVILTGIRATVVSRTPKWRIGNTCLITGQPGHPIEGLQIENISLTYPGGGTREEADRRVIDQAAAYPENTMLGLLPAYGLYLRHAKNVLLNNIQLQLETPDIRPAFMCEDVQDLHVTNLRAAGSQSESLIHLRETQNAVFQGCSTLGPIDTFLRVDSAASQGIALLGNDLRQVRTLLIRRDGFNGDIQQANNLGAQ